MRWFWDMYLSDPGQGNQSSASPLRASDLSNLPPAYIITGEYDVLRDEGEAYAARLAAAGVPVTLQRYRDMNHGFLNWVGLVDRSTEAMDHACVWIRQTMTI